MTSIHINQPFLFPKSKFQPLDKNHSHKLIRNIPTTVLTKKIQQYSFLLDQIIGEGLTSIVYKGHNDLTKQIVAIKVIDLKKNSKRDAKLLLKSQIQILKGIRHDNIVELKQVYTTNNNCYIITEYCANGTLANLIEQHGKLSQNKSIQFLRDICSGYKEIVKLNIIHRDIKPTNIFLSKNKFKIADFGFAMKYGDKQLNKINAGSPAYMPPQSLLFCQYTFKTDIFSIGILFYQMLHGYTPWRCATEKQLINKMKNRKINIDESLQLSDVTKDFLLKCLKINKDERINEKQFFNHPILSTSYVKSIDSKETRQSQCAIQFDQYQIIGKRKNKYIKNFERYRFTSQQKHSFRIDGILANEKGGKVTASLNSQKYIRENKKEKKNNDERQNKSSFYEKMKREQGGIDKMGENEFQEIIKGLEQTGNLVLKNRRNFYFKQLFDKVNYIIKRIVSVWQRSEFEISMDKTIMQDAYLKTIQKQVLIKQISKVSEFYFKRLIQIISENIDQNKISNQSQICQLKVLIKSIQHSETIIAKLQRYQISQNKIQPL